jgi:hypothetical protein
LPSGNDDELEGLAEDLIVGRAAGALQRRHPPMRAEKQSARRHLRPS